VRRWALPCPEKKTSTIFGSSTPFVLSSFQSSLFSGRPSDMVLPQRVPSGRRPVGRPAGRASSSGLHRPRRCSRYDCGGTGGAVADAADAAASTGVPPSRRRIGAGAPRGASAAAAARQRAARRLWGCNPRGRHMVRAEAAAPPASATRYRRMRADVHDVAPLHSRHDLCRLPHGRWPPGRSRDRMCDAGRRDIVH